MCQPSNIPACTSPLCYIPCFSNFRRCAAPGSFRDAPTQKIPSPAGRMAHAHASQGKEHVFNCSRLRVIKCIVHTHCPRPVGHCEAKLLKPLQTRHAASCQAAHLDVPSGGCSCGQLGSEIPSLLDRSTCARRPSRVFTHRHQQSQRRACVKEPAANNNPSQIDTTCARRLLFGLEKAELANKAPDVSLLIALEQTPVMPLEMNPLNVPCHVSASSGASCKLHCQVQRVKGKKQPV